MDARGSSAHLGHACTRRRPCWLALDAGRALGDGGVHMEWPARARRGRTHRWPRFRRSSGRAWRPARRCSGIPAPIILTTGWADSPARTCMPSPSCSRAMPPNASAAAPSTTSCLRAMPRRGACCRRWIWRRRRRSITRTIISAIATGFPSRSSKGPAKSQRPGSGKPLKAGEFILGYPDENGPPASCRNPSVLSRNGSYMAYRRLAGTRRRVSRLPASSTAQTPEEQELVAAKLMGRWRSGAPLVLAPEKDDPGAGRGPAAQQRFQLQASRTRMGMPSRSARTSGG